MEKNAMCIKGAFISTLNIQSPNYILYNKVSSRYPATQLYLTCMHLQWKTTTKRTLKTCNFQGEFKTNYDASHFNWVNIGGRNVFIGPN